MNTRPEPSPAPVAYTGLLRPAAIRVSLNEVLSGLGPLGVASTGPGVGDEVGDGTVAVGLAALGLACAVPPEPEQPVIAITAANIAAMWRILQEV
jgi:hypothetical protein